MVRLDITVENKSLLSFVMQNRVDNARSALGAGTLESPVKVPARGVRTVKLMPRVDAHGIEQGISGHLELTCKESSLVIPVEYDFLANECTYLGEPSDARVLMEMTYLGKSPEKALWGMGGAHRLLVTIDCCESESRISRAREVHDGTSPHARFNEGLVLRDCGSTMHTRHTTW